MVSSKVIKYLSHKRATLYVAILAFFSSIITYLFFTFQNPIGSDQRFIVFLSLLDFILLLSLVILLSRKIFSLWIKRRNSYHGSRLQTRILVMFSLLSSIPAILIVIFSTIFFQFVIDSWFDKKVSIVLDESVVVAESYLEEHMEAIRVRANAMALEVDNNVVRYNLETNTGLFVEIVNSLAELNALSEAAIFLNHRPIIRSKFGASLSLEIFPEEYYKKALAGEVVVIEDIPNKIRAMVALHSIPNSFLVVGKYIDNKVVDHIKKSQGASSQYNGLRDKILKTQIKFIFLFLTVSLLLLLVAMYIGVSFAGKIMGPIAALLYATKKVQNGDFSARVEEGPKNDEIADLSRAFNLMTTRISEQKNKLIEAYHEINEKMKFSEDVLAGVSTGIIVVSIHKKISLINDAGAKLLSINPEQTKDKLITNLLPELEEQLDQIIHKSDKSISAEVQLKRGNRILTFFATISKEYNHGKVTGYILAFDDMTELAEAQRYSAWSDVARRIAHEVKNPLTPIHLSAERLRSKYKGQVKDHETFEKYVNTIIKHVSDIGKIIDEFSRFARMPKAVLAEENLSKIITEIVFSRKTISANIAYKTDIEKKIKIFCDQTQINQMLINLLKNAEESIEQKKLGNKKNGEIFISLSQQDKNAVVTIIDNGIGFNEDSLSKITEPYFTTRDKGTGLGLAIVKKIVDDHNGKLIMRNEADKGAVVIVVFPVVGK